MSFTSRDLFESGVAHYSQGRFYFAELLLREAVLKCSADDWDLLGQARYSWVLSLRAQLRYDEAESEILRTLSDTSLWAWKIWFQWLYADMRFSQSRFEEAGDIYWNAFESVLQKDPDFYIEHRDVDVFADMWTCFYLAKIPEKVEQMLPHLPFDGESIGQLLAQIALPHTIHEYGGSYAQMPLESCTQCLELSFRLNPLSSTLGLLGRHLEVGGEAETAISVYRRMASLFPDGFDEDTARSFGWALQTMGLIEEAEVWLRRSALEYYPEDFAEVKPLLTFYGQNQRWNEAREVAENYISNHLFSSKRQSADDLKRAWDIHAACCDRLGESERAAESRLEAMTQLERHLRVRIANNEHPVSLIHFWLGQCLKVQGLTNEAARFFELAKEVFVTAVESNENKWWGLHWLGNFYEEHEHLELAETYFRAALRRDSSLGTVSLGVVLVKRGNLHEAEQLLSTESGNEHAKFWLGKCFRAQGKLVEAAHLFTQLTIDNPFNSDYVVTKTECQLALETTKPVPNSNDYSSFVESGRYWLQPAGWIQNSRLLLRITKTLPRTRMLARLFNGETQWADPNIPLFNDFDVSEEDLDDTLARAVAISSRIHLMPEVPIKLETRNLSIEFDLEGQLLRAWVGRNSIGIPISVNVTTWELFYVQENRDAMFAVGAAINWFLDCSISLYNHSNFERLEANSAYREGTTDAAGNSWTTRQQFHTDIEQMRSGHLPLPPRAHRVRGHIRRLGDGTPSDSARDNAPPYIRRHMAPGETWVRGHNRGGDVAGDQLINRLRTSSSLADFLGTARRV